MSVRHGCGWSVAAGALVAAAVVLAPTAAVVGADKTNKAAAKHATDKRDSSLPNVPTTKEAGLPDYQASAWNALFAPKDTPKEIVASLSAALDKALDDDLTRKRLLELGSDIPGKDRRGGTALHSLVKTEIAKWSPVIKAAGATN